MYNSLTTWALPTLSDPNNRTAFDRYHVCLIPAPIDLDDILTKYPPVEIPIYKAKATKIRDALAWFIGNLYTARQSAKRKKIALPNGWTRICSKILENTLSKEHYSKFLQYLVRVELLEIDNSYSNTNGFHFCKKMRIAGAFYCNKFNTYNIYDHSLLNRIWTSKNSNLKGIDKRYGFLTKWFNELTIDMDLAKKILLDFYPENYPYVKYTLNYVERTINWNEDVTFKYSLSGRLFTPITNLKKELKAALRVKGKSLIEVDYKNSIPYVGLVLYNKGIIKENNRVREILEKNIDKRGKYYKDIKEGRYKQIPYMSPDFDIDSDKIPSDLLIYQQKVLDGSIYDHMAELWNQKLPSSHATPYDRASAKLKFLEILNRPNFMDSGEKEVLVAEFPTFTEVVSLVNAGFTKTKKKSNGKINKLGDGDLRCPFAMITQRLEAHLILDLCCKRITNQYPYIPLYTIHDSILTLPQYVDTVERIMNEESLKLFKLPSRTKVTIL